VRVVLADDEPLMQAGLRTVLEVGGTVRVVGEADDPADGGTGSAVR
jgi:DNA-binding NarL/FixJ family response regulator